MDLARPRLSPAVAATRLAVRPYVSDGPVAVACSGGADSLALAAAVAFEAPGSVLVTVDHGLQEGSAERAVRVVELGGSLGLRACAVRVEVGTAGGPEAAARTARYAALAEHAPDGAAILLGHTLDDQAETVLLGLGRGSGARSLAGMVAVDGRWVRPFLGLRRAVTVEACAAQGLPVWDDPHNADPRFQRARLRHEVLPLLEEVLQGGVAEALARTAAQLRDDADALDEWAAAALPAALAPGPAPATPVSAPAIPVPAPATPVLVINTRPDRPGPAAPGVDHGEGGGLVADALSVEALAALSVEALAALPRAVRTRVLRAWASAHGAGPLTAVHTAGLDALVTGWHGQGPIPLPGGVSVRRVSGTMEP